MVFSLLQRYSREAGGENAARHVQDVYEYEGCWEKRLAAAEKPERSVVVASSCSALWVESELGGAT